MNILFYLVGAAAGAVVGGLFSQVFENKDKNKIDNKIEQKPELNHNIEGVLKNENTSAGADNSGGDSVTYNSSDNRSLEESTENNVNEEKSNAN